MLVILQNKYYPIDIKKKDDWEIFNLLTNPVIMKGILSKNSGGLKTKENIKKVNDFFKDDLFFQSIVEYASQINDKNCSMIVRRTKASWSTFKSQIKEFYKNPKAYQKKYGNKGKPQKPKAKKLKNIVKSSINLEESKWSLRRIKTKKSKKPCDYFCVTIHKQQVKIPLKHKGVLTKVGLKNIKNAKIKYSNKLIYIQFSYEKELIKKKKLKKKVGAIDIGMNNIISLFINDKATKSLIIDGRKFKSKNTKYNRFNAKLNESISNEAIEFIEIKDKKYPSKYTQKGLYLKEYKSFLTEKRNQYFENEFHQISKNVVNYLIKNEVTELVISKNLSFLKTKGDIKLSKKVRQSFIHMPFGKLLSNIEAKCIENGIKIHDIDEAYTSKTSCLSQNIHDILRKKEEKTLSSKDYTGSRVERGLYRDKVTKIAINADLNGAVNHIVRNDENADIIDLRSHLFKVCNPIKIKSNSEFLQLLAA
jgi:IS605 OrfB family transposase